MPSKDSLSGAASVSTSQRTNKRTGHTVDNDNGIRIVHVKLPAGIVLKVLTRLGIGHLKSHPSVAPFNTPEGKLSSGCRPVEMQIKRVQLLSCPVCVAESSSQKSRTDGRLAN